MSRSLRRDLGLPLLLLLSQFQDVLSEARVWNPQAVQEQGGLADLLLSVSSKQDQAKLCKHGTNQCKCKQDPCKHDTDLGPVNRTMRTRTLVWHALLARSAWHCGDRSLIDLNLLSITSPAQPQYSRLEVQDDSARQARSRELTIELKVPVPHLQTHAHALHRPMSCSVDPLCIDGSDPAAWKKAISPTANSWENVAANRRRWAPC